MMIMRSAPALCSLTRTRKLTDSDGGEAESRRGNVQGEY
jgi:hypothetical protein